MSYSPISPFMRPITHNDLKRVNDNTTPTPSTVNKWKILRDLSKCQSDFGINQRDLTVLQALISFHPKDDIGNAPTIIFPSNKTICERLHDMPCSTMRRHLGRLIDAGLVARKDSPTGKRYIRKNHDSETAFGFDLSPLNRQATIIAEAAEAARQSEIQIKLKREAISLMRRDLIAILSLGRDTEPKHDLWSQIDDAITLNGKTLRRKLSEIKLDQIITILAEIIAKAQVILCPIETTIIGTDNAHNEQRLLNSKKEYKEYEQANIIKDSSESNTKKEFTNRKIQVSLNLVTTVCKSLQSFYPKQIQSWDELFNAASNLRPAMGISISAWKKAIVQMGQDTAAITLVAMLERFSKIKNPSGYLNALTIKASQNSFTPEPMIMALSRTQ